MSRVEVGTRLCSPFREVCFCHSLGVMWPVLEPGVVRPNGESPFRPADEVSVEVGHAEVVNRLPLASVLRFADRHPAIFGADHVPRLDLASRSPSLALNEERVLLSCTDHLFGLDRLPPAALEPVLVARFQVPLVGPALALHEHILHPLATGGWGGVRSARRVRPVRRAGWVAVGRRSTRWRDGGEFPGRGHLSRGLVEPEVLATPPGRPGRRPRLDASETALLVLLAAAARAQPVAAQRRRGHLSPFLLVSPNLLLEIAPAQSITAGFSQISLIRPRSD